MKRIWQSLLLGVLLSGAILAAQTAPPVQVVKPAAPAGVTKEKLQARLTELQKGRDQAMANVNAYDGAIQECQYWISQVEESEKGKKGEVKPAEPKKEAPAVKK